MNMLYEGLKQNATIAVVPSKAVELTQPGRVASLTAFTMELDWQRSSQVDRKRSAAEQPSNNRI